MAPIHGQAKSSIKPDNKPPPTTLYTDIEGKKIDINTIQTPLIIVHFWATWCPPCLVEFPSLLNYVTANPNQATILTVSGDFSYENLQRFIRNNPAEGLPLHWIWDENNQLMQSYNISAIPQSFIIGPNRKIIAHIPRETNWNDKTLRAQLTNLAKISN